MQKKKVMAILLSTAIAASTFIGCGTDKAKDYKDTDTVMFIDKDNKIDYATACTYTRMMQAETYSYMQSIASYEMHDELLGYSSSKIVDGTLMYVADGHVEMSVKLSGKTLRLTLERI